MRKATKQTNAARHQRRDHYCHQERPFRSATKCIPCSSGVARVYGARGEIFFLSFLSLRTFLKETLFFLVVSSENGVPPLRPPCYAAAQSFSVKSWRRCPLSFCQSEPALIDFSIQIIRIEHLFPFCCPGAILFLTIPVSHQFSKLCRSLPSVRVVPGVIRDRTSAYCKSFSGFYQYRQ